MNIEQAKTIPLSLILAKMNPGFTKQDGFYIHPEKNVYYEGKGKNSLDLVCAYLKATGESATLSDALRWLNNMTGNKIETPRLVGSLPKVRADKGWLLKMTDPVEHMALVRYLENQGIPLLLAKQHLKEVEAQHPKTRKIIYALGFRNEDGGYELQNPFLKSFIPPRTVSFIRGVIPKPTIIHLFKDWLDYLSVLSKWEKELSKGDSIVYHIPDCLKDVWPYLKGYGYRRLYSWLPNTPAGMESSQAVDEFAQTEEGLLHHPMNELYKSQENIATWYKHGLGL